ncbi:MAG: hypothetical protein KDI19_12015, partial [Pseudomonadales bacterium]|nr:hypothetical protein [Pseudomonadales bacterium]
MGNAFDELMSVRGQGTPAEAIEISGRDPILSTRFKLGETGAAVMAAIGVAVNDLWEMRTGKRQDLSVKASHAAAALRSYNYMRVEGDEDQRGFAAQLGRQRISTPHPTRDGRFFLPHMRLPHLAERILRVLDCEFELESVRSALMKWDALDLENAIAEARACGAMVRSADEWLAHPHGQALAAKPVVE